MSPSPLPNLARTPYPGVERDVQTAVPRWDIQKSWEDFYTEADVNKKFTNLVAEFSSAIQIIIRNHTKDISDHAKDISNHAKDLIQQHKENLRLHCTIEAKNLEVHRLHLLSNVLPLQTGSHAETWTAAKPEILNVTNTGRTLKPIPGLEAYKNLVFQSEAGMYNPFVKLLGDIIPTFGLQTQPQVLDTHKTPYLDGRQPDISIIQPQISSPHPSSVWLLVELKAPTETLDNSAKGQCLGYLARLRTAQPWRKKFACMLANQSVCHWITVEFSGPNPDVSVTAPMNLHSGLEYLWAFLADQEYRPSLPSFQLADGPFEVLGVTRGSLVISSGGYAVKRVWPQQEKDLQREISALKIAKDGVNVAQIANASPDNCEVRFTPAGFPLDALAASRLSSLDSVLHDVHAGLVFLHSKSLLHRDIRWENIVWDSTSGKAVIVDLGSALSLTNLNVVTYEGGYLCCPRALLGKPAIKWQYLPSCSDDWDAYILLVNAAMFPYKFAGFDSEAIRDPDSPATKSLQQLWKALEESSTWGVAVRAVKEETPSSLKDWVTGLVVSMKPH